MTRKEFYIASAVTTAVSVAGIVTYAVKKATKGKACAWLLLAGMAGLAASAALVTKPDRDAAKSLAEEILLDDADADLMQLNISEILGTGADHVETPKKLRQIEVDEDATIEDFI